MARNEKKSKKEPISPIAVAEEINTVFGYGTDPDGEPGVIVDEGELIVLTQPVLELIDEIKERCANDLTINDEPAFTPEAWTWMLENGIQPIDPEAADEDEDEEDDATEDDDEESDDADDTIEDEEEEDEEPAKPAKKADKAKERTTPSTAKEKKAPAKAATEVKTRHAKDKDEKKATDKPAKEATGEKKKVGFGRGRGKPSIESVVIEATKANHKIKLEDVVALITPIYAELGKKDAATIEKRAAIYLQIALVKTGIKEKSERGAAMAAYHAKKKEAAAPAKEEKKEEAPKKKERK